MPNLVIERDQAEALANYILGLKTDPDKPDSGIRLLPRVSNGEALVGPGMKDARRGEPVGDQLRHPVPREAF